MTSSIKAASNGDGAAESERVTGMTRVRKAEVYHLASVAHDAALEAERLCDGIYRTVSAAYLRDSRASDQAIAAPTGPVTTNRVDEALGCLNAAVRYLTRLINVFDPDDPAF